MGKKSLGFGWNDAAALLTKTYKRFYRKNPRELDDEIADLFYHLKEYKSFKADISGDDVTTAIKNYIYNDEYDDHNESGKYFPDISTIARELRYVVNGKKRMQSEELKGKMLSFEDDRPMVTVSVVGTPLEEWFNEKEFEAIAMEGSKCMDCYDKGLVRFYYIKDRPYHVFTAKEWIKLYDRDQAKADMFTCGMCYCDHCELGRLMYVKYHHNIMKPPLLSTIMQLVDNRKKRKKEIEIQQSIIEGGEQGDLLQTSGEWSGEAIDPETRLVTGGQIGPK